MAATAAAEATPAAAAAAADDGADDEGKAATGDVIPSAGRCGGLMRMYFPGDPCCNRMVKC